MSNLDFLIGKNIRVNKSGPGSISGRVLAAKADYLVLKHSESEVIYVNIHHIQKIIPEGKEDIPETDGQLKYLDAENFADLLQSLPGCRVYINEGPEGLNGIVKAINEDFLELMINGQSGWVFNFHIRMVKTSFLSREPAEADSEKTLADKAEEKQIQETNDSGCPESQETEKTFKKILRQLVNRSHQ